MGKGLRLVFDPPFKYELSSSQIEFLEKCFAACDMKTKNLTPFVISAIVACNFICKTQPTQAQIGATPHQSQSFFFENRSTYRKFITQLKAAIQENDRETVAGMIEYPFQTTVSGNRMIIRKKEQFIQGYEIIFTRKIKNAILAQPDEIFFSSSQGIMIGEGEVWIGQPEKIVEIKILSINN